jgi:alpha-L-fucosidase
MIRRPFRSLFTTMFVIATLTSMIPETQAQTSVSGTGEYEARWESLDQRPTPQWWKDGKFGIFIHWGTYAVPAWGKKGTYAEWYWQALESKRYDGATTKFHADNYGSDFKYEQFAPMFKAELFDPDQWAEIFAESGAKYVVLTSKHHEGYCLWPSEHASKTWGRPWNSVEVGPKRDLLGDLTNSVRRKGLKMGIYFSLYEWYNPLWLSDRDKYVTAHMIPQFKDVVTRYQPSVIFSDGEWDMPDKKWHSEQILAWLYNESPSKDDVIVNDRWGKGCRHVHGGYYTTEYGAGLPNATHPWEENRGMGHSYGYNRNEDLAEYRTSKELVWMLADLVSRGGNLLLNVGPTADGRIPTIQEERLRQTGAWLKVNQEAIYASKPFERTCQWSEGTVPEGNYKQYMSGYDILNVVGAEPIDGIARKRVFFTTKPGVVYAILPMWPGDELRLKNMPAGNATASMLGLEGRLACRREGDDLLISMPDVAPDQLPCDYAWTIKIEGLE